MHAKQHHDLDTKAEKGGPYSEVHEHVVVVQGLKDVRFLAKIIGTGLLLWGLTFPVSVVAQHQNGALHFDGRDDFITADAVFAEMAVDTLRAFTLECWFYLQGPTQFDDPNDRSPGVSILALNFPLEGRLDNLAIIEYLYEGPEKHRFAAGFFRPPIPVNVPSTNTFEPGHWYHAALTLDTDNTGYLYINGQREASFRANGRPTRTSTFSIGQEWDGIRPSEFFHGQIDEVRLWSIARTPDDIQRDMHRILTGNEAGLFGYWPLDAIENGYVQDRSRRGHPGLLHHPTSPEGPNVVESGAPLFDTETEYMAALWHGSTRTHSGYGELQAESILQDSSDILYFRRSQRNTALVANDLPSGLEQRWSQTWRVDTGHLSEKRGQFTIHVNDQAIDTTRLPIDAGRYRLIYRTHANSMFNVVTDGNGEPLAAIREGGRLVFAVALGESQAAGQPVFGGEYTVALRPLWYTQWWALVLFGAGGFSLLYGIVWTRTYQLERSKRKLEQQVATRTAEVEQQKTQLEKQAEQLRALDEMKSRFFANISHEFRTPLTLIMGPLQQALREGYVPEPLKEQHHMMLRNAQRLQHMIDQILDLAKVETGGLTLGVEHRNLVTHVQHITQSFVALAERHTIALTFHADVPEHLVYFDPEQLEKILTNLLSNALKFTPGGGAVEVTCRGASEDWVEISIADTGLGIAPEHLPHLFDRFYQADASITRIQEGTGIGLALTKELVALHKGELAVESVLGQGSTFRVRLRRGRRHFMAHQIRQPRPPEVENASSSTSVSDLSVPTSGGDGAEGVHDASTDQTTVLVVEDNADLQSFIASVLGSAYRVRVAANGREGLALAQKALPDLIVSDVMMPEMDGFTMNKALKQDLMTATIPVVLLTAKATPEDQVEGLDTGAEAYLTKPFEADVLRAQVASLLKQRLRLREHFQAGGPASPVSPETSVSAFEQQVRAVVAQHLSDPGFSIQQLADAVALSRSQLNRRLQQTASQSAGVLIREMRLVRAVDLLEQEAGTISEIAYAVGFNSLTYFTRCFRTQYGTIPSAYVKERV